VADCRLGSSACLPRYPVGGCAGPGSTRARAASGPIPRSRAGTRIQDENQGNPDADARTCAADSRNRASFKRVSYWPDREPVYAQARLSSVGAKVWQPSANPFPQDHHEDAEDRSRRNCTGPVCMTPADPPAAFWMRPRPLACTSLSFCRARCPYCDFARQCASRFGIDDYAAVVVAELAARAGLVRGESAPNLQSIYFGGGTPGWWRPQAIGRVMETTRRAFDATGPLEIRSRRTPAR